MQLVLFDLYIEPYQVQPFQARVDLGAMAMKGVLYIPQSSCITGTSVSDCLESNLGNSLGGSYPSALYSTAPADWAMSRSCSSNCACIKQVHKPILKLLEDGD